MARTTKKKTKARTTKKRTARKPSTGRTAKTRSTTRATTKRTPAKRTTTTGAAAADAAPAAQGKPMRLDAANSARSKSEVYTLLAEYAGISKKEVAYIFDGMSQIIKKDLAKRGPGEFKVPGMMKIKRRDIPRRPARKNVYVPLLKEYRDIPAKPARTSVKVTPLKGLKELV